MNTEEPRILLLDTLFSTTILQKIFLEDDKITRQNALREIHDSQAGGHLGIVNTWELVRQHYEGPRLREFAKNMSRDVSNAKNQRLTSHKEKHLYNVFVRNLGSRFLQDKGNGGNIEDKGLTREC